MGKNTHSTEIRNINVGDIAYTSPSGISDVLNSHFTQFDQSWQMIFLELILLLSNISAILIFAFL